MRSLDAPVLPFATVSARLVTEPQRDPPPEVSASETKPPEPVAPASTRPVAPPTRPERRASKRAARTSIAPLVAHSAPTRESPPTVAPAEVSLPMPRDPTWYTAKQLDAFPKALAPIRPTYPEVDGLATRGRVLVLMLVDERGEVTEASVVEADPAGHFEESALAAVRNARFEPGRKAGRIVKSRLMLELTYGPR